MLQANKLLKTQVKALSVEFANKTFNVATIQTRLMDVLNVILAAEATAATHCCLALVAIVSFSLRMKQIRRQNPKDNTSIQLLVANLFTVGCSGVGESDDILHSVCKAGIPIKPSVFALIFPSYRVFSSGPQRCRSDGCTLRSNPC